MPLIHNKHVSKDNLVPKLIVFCINESPNHNVSCIVHIQVGNILSSNRDTAASNKGITATKRYIYKKTQQYKKWQNMDEVT